MKTNSLLETDIFNYKTPEFYINMKDIPDKKSSERKAFVLEEKRKCKEGININGVHIPGSLYFHLNYYHLQGDDLKSGRKAVFLPRLRDNEWIIFNDYEEAFSKKLIYTLLGARQIAKSEIETSLCLREICLFKETEAMALFSGQPDKDTFVKKMSTAITHGESFMIIPNIDKDWGKDEIRFGFTRPDNTTELRARLYIYNTQDGKRIQVGSGKSVSFLLMDEIAKSDFRAVYDTIEPALLSDMGTLRCSPILAFTGGETEKARDAKNLVENPITGKQFTTVIDNNKIIGGRFMSGLYRKDCKEEKPFSEFIGKTTNTWLDNYPIYVSNLEKAATKIEEEKQDALKSPDKSTFTLKRIFFPLTLDDVFLTESNNKFPIEVINQHREWLSNHYEPSYVDLFRDKLGKVQWKYSLKRPLRKFPVKPEDDKDSCLEIYEFPIQDAPKFTYCIGCLPPGEKVMTEEGLKDIEKVTLNNKLINDKGELVEIYNLQKYLVEDEDLYEIKVGNTYRTTKFTKEHPLLVSKEKIGFVSSNKAKRLNVRYRFKKFDFSYKEIKDVNEGDWIKVPNIYKKAIDFDYNSLWDNFKGRYDFSIDSPLNHKDFWWFVGLWLGDGWNEKRDKVMIAFNKAEPFYIEKFEEVCKNLFKRNSFVRKDNKNCYEIGINFKQLSNFLSSTFGKYSYGKLIPEWVKYLPNEYKQELLRGYLNSDGCVHLNKKGYLSTEFVSINLPLLESFQDILFSLGCTSSITKLRNKSLMKIKSDSYSVAKDCYHLRMNNLESVNFLKSIFDSKDHKIKKAEGFSVNFEKKRERDCFFSDDLEFIYFKVLKINHTKYSGVVHNFECDTHTYMCHHVTTHNCDPVNADESSSDIVSLFSICVYKRMISPLDEFKNQVVASIAFRPKELSEAHELALMLSEFYNAVGGVLPEASENSIFQYFYLKKKGQYLADSFDLNKEINFKTKFKGKKGLPPTTPNQRHYMGLLIEDANKEVISINDEGEEITTYGVTLEHDTMLLEEYKEYKSHTSGRGVHNGNYDRIISRGCAETLARFYDIKFPIVQMPKSTEHVERNTHNFLATPFGNIPLNRNNNVSFSKNNSSLNMPRWMKR